MEAPKFKPIFGQLEREFEVAMEFVDWICVVVPGCGFGWTQSAAISSRQATPSKCPPDIDPAKLSGLEDRPEPRAAANVKTLCHYGHTCMYDTEGWQADEYDDIEDIKRLLRMIGHGLIGLDDVSHGIYISDDDLRQILDTCPNLTRLNFMDNQLDGITSLLERYAKKQRRIE